MKTGPETQKPAWTQLEYSRRFPKPKKPRNCETPTGPAHLEKSDDRGARKHKIRHNGR
jgi:hypothetical protein